MQNYQTIKEAGYKFLWHTKGELVLMDENGVIEFFRSRKDFLGFGIKWKNTSWEFTNSYNETEKIRLINGLKKILHFGEQHPSFKYAYNLIKKF